MSSNELPRVRATIYKVIVNHEGQYSIWPADRENALGWNDVGEKGTRAECLAYIKKVWTDMRPLSARKEMDELGQTHDNTKYELVVEEGEVFSLWPADRENARRTGQTGSAADCLEYLSKALGERGPVK